jgi:hypothetical protein
MVAEYAPPMAPPGTATAITGLQVTVVLPSTFVALTTSCGFADRLTVGWKPKVAGPVALMRPLME